MKKLIPSQSGMRSAMRAKGNHRLFPPGKAREHVVESNERSEAGANHHGGGVDGNPAVLSDNGPAQQLTADQLRLLWEAARALLSNDDPHAMLLALLARLGPALGLDTYFSYLVDDAGEDLRLISWVGVATKVPGLIVKLDHGRTIIGEVALRRRPIYVPYVQQSTDPLVRAIKSLGLRAYVCNPLMSGGVLLGTLAYGSRSRDQFEPDELAVVQTIAHYVGVAYARLAHAEGLLVSEIRYRRLFEAAHDGILILDPGTRKITDANPFMTRLLGYSRGQLVGKELFEIGLLKDEPASRKMFRKLKSERKIRYENLPLESKAGRRHEVEVVANLYQENKRSVIQCNIRDITARKLAEAQQHRLDMMTASNHKLRREIIRRHAVEAALRHSEQEARQLLHQARQLQKQLRRVSHQIVESLENQRRKISRELHDDISQILVGINVHLAVFAKSVELDPAGVRRTIAPLHTLVEKSLQIVHRFARELRPSSLDDLGLISAIKAYIDDFPKQKGQRIHFTAFTGVESINSDKRTMLFRITQEALTNVAKHARASRVEVRIRKTRNRICLQITDDGRAFAVKRIASAGWSNRLGLVGMRERVEMLGGDFTVRSKPGTGTTIRAEIPFDERENPKPPRVVANKIRKV